MDWVDWVSGFWVSCVEERLLMFMRFDVSELSTFDTLFPSVFVEWSEWDNGVDGFLAAESIRRV